LFKIWDRAWWFTPAIMVSWEVEIGGSQSNTNPRQKLEALSEK
jgi:hypothetical protein